MKILLNKIEILKIFLPHLVPQNVFKWVFSTSLLSPMSAILTWRLCWSEDTSRTFSGLRSLWQMFLEWRYFTAEASW